MPKLNFEFVIAVALCLLAKTSQGQAITWGSPVTIGAHSTVLNDGTVDWAYSFGGVGQTINGINFAGVGTVSAFSGNISLSDPSNLGFFPGTTFGGGGGADPITGLSSNYSSLMSAGMGWTEENITVTLLGLTAGQTYQLQFWVNDSRQYVQTEYRNETLDDGHGNTVDVAFNAGNTNDGPGQTVTGNFTATSSTESFTLDWVSEGHGDNASPTQINAMDLQTLAVPEPSSCALWMGLAAVAAGIARIRSNRTLA